MIAFLVDPFLLRMPSTHETKDEVVGWAKAITKWLEEWKCTPHFYSVSADTITSLIHADLWPTFQGLRSLDIKFKLHDSDINTMWIFQQLTSFIYQQYNIDEFTQIESYVCQNEQIEPKEFLLRLEPNESAIAASIHRINIGFHTHLISINEVNLITWDPKPALGDEIFSLLNLISCTPHHACAECRSEKIKYNMPIFKSPDKLLGYNTSIADEFNLGEERITWLINAMITKQAGIKLFEFKFHDKFRTSIIENALINNETLLDKIFRICALISMGYGEKINIDLRPLRESKAADAKQVTRDSDSAKAWRLTVTNEGVGWRLHYWKYTDANGNIIVEFCNVLKKHDAEKIFE